MLKKMLVSGSDKVIVQLDRGACLIAQAVEGFNEIAGEALRDMLKGNQ